MGSAMYFVKLYMVSEFLGRVTVCCFADALEKVTYPEYGMELRLE